MNEYFKYIINLEKATSLSLTSSSLLSKLNKFADHILYWSGFTNLTTFVHKDEVFLYHFLDSFTCLYFWKKEWKVVYDVGTGAGLPGIPLALIFEKTKFILIESNVKKCDLLKLIIKGLNLHNVEVINKRAEDVVVVNGDCVLTRAVSRLDIVLEITCRLLAKGGNNLLMRGQDYLKEIHLSKIKVKDMGYELEKTVKIIDIPDRITSLVLYKLVNIPPSIYPRRFAKIKRS